MLTQPSSQPDSCVSSLGNWQWPPLRPTPLGRRPHFCQQQVGHVGAVGCWCLCAPQLALVIRPQAGRPPTPRPTPPRTPTPDDSVSSPTQPNLLATVITSSEFTENRHVLYATFLWTRSWFPAEGSILSKSILACHNPASHSNGGDNDSWDGKGVGDIGGGALRRRQACCGLRWVNKRGRRSCLSLSPPQAADPPLLQATSVK